jgi:predicted  nucleic acid-binding Zn-ribbon protein
MGATLEALLELQNVELQIVDIKRQLGSRQRSVARQEKKLAEAQRAVEEARDEYRRTQISLDEVDLNLKTRNAAVGKLRDNLNSVRTNKEYAAVLSQLNTEKADVTRLESRAYELMSEVEEKKKLHADRGEAVHEEQRRLENLKEQLRQAEASFSERLGGLEQKRDAAQRAIDPKTVELFNRLSERYEGEAMARIEQTHPRRQEYMCDGCNMAVTAERANAAMTESDVVTCGSCGRILYIEK